MGDTTTRLATIALERAEWPDPERVIAAAAELGCPLVLDRVGDLQEYRRAGGELVAVQLIGERLPDIPDLATGPTAVMPAPAMATAAHLRVVPMKMPGTDLERDKLLAVLTTAVLEQVPAVGAMFAHGVVLHRANSFSAVTRVAVDLDAPLGPELFADITLDVEIEPRLVLRTHHMPRWGQPNCMAEYTRGQGDDALDALLHFVRYLVDPPPAVIRAGHTFGRVAGERIRIVHAADTDGAAMLRLVMP